MSRLGTGGLDITVTNNTVNAPTIGIGFCGGLPCPFSPIYLESRDSNMMLADVSGNITFDPNFGAGSGDAYHLFEVGTSTFQLFGGPTDCGGSPCANATAQIAGTNTGTPVNVNAGVSLTATAPATPTLP